MISLTIAYSMIIITWDGDVYFDVFRISDAE